MKKLVTALVALSSLSVFAGTLENKQTGEYLEFDYDAEKKELTMTSTSTNTNSHVFKVKKLNRMKYSGVNLFGTTVGACEEFWWNYQRNGADYTACMLVPLANIPGIGAAVVDTAMLPVKLPLHLLKEAKYKADYKKLKKAILSDEVIRVSNKRFKRIENVYFHRNLNQNFEYKR